MPRVLSFLLLTAIVSPAFSQTREEKVRNDKAKVEKAGVWIYNDLPKAFAEAKKTGKPIIAVLRCLPCEECVKLDDELIDADERITKHLDQFVRVRLVSTNGLDLSLFQFDTDQSFCVFFLNADGTIYGRFGTRSHRKNWIGDVSVDGLAKAMAGTLTLHAEYPKNKPLLAAKRGPAPEFARPELFPSLKAKYTSALNYKGNVVQSCIHCHQIGDAVRELAFSRKEKLPEETLFPYPHPSSIGLTMDPKELATILKVEPNSLAAKAGLKAGNVIQSLNGQPLLSIADIQWVLHNVPATGGTVHVGVQLGPKAEVLLLKLPAGWRRAGDISWRASTWGLRRKALGGMKLDELTAEERTDLKLPADKLALRIAHVGQYAPHDVAKRAGFQKGDLLVGFDGHAEPMRESDLILHALTQRKPGDTLAVEILRGNQRRTVRLTLP